jgi:hypothetical protein
MLIRTIRTAFLTAITLGLPAVAAATPAQPASVVVKHAPAAASATDSSSYAEREARATDVAEFQGGTIDSSAGTAVLVSGAVIVLAMFIVIGLLAI